MTPRFLLALALLILLATPLTQCGVPDAAEAAGAAEGSDVVDVGGRAIAAEPAEAAEASDGADAAVQGDVEAACHSSYPDFCIPPPPPDLNCPDVDGKKPFRVRGADPHRFDRDRDGWACEPNPRKRRN